MLILAIDPGSEQSGWVVLSDAGVTDSGTTPNGALLTALDGFWHDGICTLAIEMMRARGMPMSNDAMRTLVWVGRFQQAWREPEAVQLVYREAVKLHVCGSAKAKDSNIRAALLDLVGPQGTKKAPGPTHGVSSHAWAALGVAVTARAQLGAGA